MISPKSEHFATLVRKRPPENGSHGRGITEGTESIRAIPAIDDDRASGSSIDDRASIVRPPRFAGCGRMTSSVLVPIDGSPLSRKALRHAVEEFPDAAMTVLHVVDLFEPGYGATPDVETSFEPLMGSEEWYERAEEISDRLFADAEGIANEYDREIATVSEIGDPSRIIVDYADEEDIDHIVLGAHGRTAENRPIFGSNAELVARRAPVPVTLVR